MDGPTSPPLQQHQPAHPSTRIPSLPTSGVPDVATFTPRTSAQPVIESATTTVVCTTTQSCAENPGDPIIQCVTSEPYLPGTAQLNHHKTAGPIPGPLLTDAIDPAASTGRATPPTEVDTPIVAPAEAL